MALVLADRVRDTTTTTGTGTVTLSGTAPTGYQNFSVVGNNNTTYYTINAGSQWEVGIGTYSTTGPSLSRDTVLSSSSAGALVNFSAGTKDVFITYPSGESVYQDGSAIKAGSAILAVPNGGTGAATLTGYVKGTGTAALTASATIPVSDISGGTALTKTDDTNVTLTLGGSPTTALLAATSITAGWTGQLAVSRGGTGASALTLNGVLYGNHTSAISATAAGTTGQVLVGNTGAAPSWSAASSVGVTSIGFGTTGLEPFVATKGDIVVTGTLAASSGGTGATTLASGYLLKGNGTSAVSASVVYDTGTNVGIGTTSPGFKLEVTGDIRLGSGGDLRLGSATGTTGSSGDSSIFSDANDMYLNTGNATRVYIANGGNVGIGNTGPTYRLDVSSADTTANLGYAMRIRANATAGGGTFQFTDSSATAQWGFLAATATSVTLDATNASILAFRTNNNERMRIDSSGNVGIGTSSPGQKLEVNGITKINTASATWEILQLVNTQASSGAYMQMVGAPGGTVAIGADATTASTMIFRTAATERMRIDSSGNVGIGTSSPQARLHTDNASSFTQLAVGGSALVAGINFRNSVYTNGYIYYDNGASMNFQTNGSEKMRIDFSGNVGIGTTAPQGKLDVQSRSSGAVTTGLVLDNRVANSVNTGIDLRFYVNDGGDARYAAVRSVQSTSGNYADLRFLTSASDTPTERMRIAADGNVMIGNSAGAPKFSVTLGTYAWGSGWNSGAALIGGNGQASGAGSGGLGITYDDTVGATLGPLIPGVAWKPLRFFSDNIQFNTNGGTEYMRLTSGGNLGIGTTSPTYKLEVQGSPAWIRNFAGTPSSPTETQDWPVSAFNVASYGDFTLQTMMAFTLPNDGNYFLGYGVWNFKLDQTASSTTSAGVNGMQFGGPGYLSFMPGTSEKARITSGGALLVGTTAPLSGNTSNEFKTTTVGLWPLTINSNDRGILYRQSSSSVGYYAYFEYNGGTNNGSISYSGGTTAYNTTSDARIKKNIVDAPDAGSLIDAIKVRSWDFKADDVHWRYGMVAQELLPVAPEAVTVPEDEDKMMGIDYAKLVPMLIKELQSVRARLAQLEGN